MVAAKRKRKKTVKDAHLNMRLTTEHLATISEAAARVGLSASSWVLSVALREAGADPRVDG